MLWILNCVQEMMEEFIEICRLPRLYCVALGVRDNIIDKDGCTHAYRKSAVPDVNLRGSQATVVVNHPTAFCLEGTVMLAWFRAPWGRWLGFLGAMLVAVGSGLNERGAIAQSKAKSDAKAAS